MSKQWTPADVLQLTSGYQAACVLAAAADLDLFSRMAGRSFSADEAAASLEADKRATAALLDALAALGLLEKVNGQYQVPAALTDLLTPAGSRSVLAMVQHQANCLRRWSQLARVVKTGKPELFASSIRGEAADYTSFIEAMDNVSRPMADPLVAQLGRLEFRHLLDVGGGSGTWTLAFLRANPQATATIFDLPKVMPQAQQRIEAAGMTARVKLVGGDYLLDPLPRGADLAWVSAIIHSLSRQQIRELCASVFAALVPGGRILIRDFVMDESRTQPAGGAMFAVNMLSATEGGGTYTFNELKAELTRAGFGDVNILHREDTMNAVVTARKA
jgi:SAM-dependent methyltransferase